MHLRSKSYAVLFFIMLTSFGCKTSGLFPLGNGDVVGGPDKSPLVPDDVNTPVDPGMDFLLCNGQALVTVSASGFQAPNVAANAYDGSVDTRWSQLGQGEYLQMDFCEPTSIDIIALRYPTTFTTPYSVTIETTTDGLVWTSAAMAPNKSLQGLTPIDVSQTNLMGIRIVNNLSNDWISIEDVVFLSQQSMEVGPIRYTPVIKDITFSTGNILLADVNTAIMPQVAIHAKRQLKNLTVMLDGMTLYSGSDLAAMPETMFPEGDHEITVVVTDDQDEETRKTFLRSTTEDAPAIASLTPLNNSSHLQDATIAVAATADVLAGRNINRIEFHLDGALVKSDSSAPYTHTLSNLSVGNHTIKATVVDSIGKQASQTNGFMIEMIDDEPEVTALIPGSGSQFFENMAINVSATAEVYNGRSINAIEFFVDGALVKSDTSSPYTYLISSLAVGSHSIEAVVTDSNGKTDAKMHTFTVAMMPNNGSLGTYPSSIDFAGQNLPLYVERGYDSFSFAGNQTRMLEPQWSSLFEYRFGSACHQTNSLYDGNTIDHISMENDINGVNRKLRKTFLGDGSWGPNSNSGKSHNGCNVREIRVTDSNQSTSIMCAVTRVKWSPEGTFIPIPVADRNSRRIGGKVGFSVASYINKNAANASSYPSKQTGEIVNHPGACQGAQNEKSGSYFALMFRDTIRKSKVPGLAQDQFTTDGFYLAAYSMHKNRTTLCAEDLFVQEPNGDFFVWLPDTWVEVEMCVQANTFSNGVAQADGSLRLRVNRQNVASKNNLVISEVSPNLTHAGFDDMFAGGDSSSWAFKQDVFWHYDKVKIYTTQGNTYPFGPMVK